MSTYCDRDSRYVLRILMNNWMQILNTFGTVEDVPAHCRVVWWDELWRPLPIQAVLWFYGTRDQTNHLFLWLTMWESDWHQITLTGTKLHLGKHISSNLNEFQDDPKFCKGLRNNIVDFLQKKVSIPYRGTTIHYFHLNLHKVILLGNFHLQLMLCGMHGSLGVPQCGKGESTQDVKTQTSRLTGF